MSKLTFEYDSMRGGFRLSFETLDRENVKSAFSGFLSIFENADGKIAALESDFGDHGGMPLRKIHGTAERLEGMHQVLDDNFRIGPILLRQCPERIELWFSTGEHMPRDHWTLQEEQGVSLWFSQQKALAGWPVPGTNDRVECALLAGLAVSSSRLSIKHPIHELQLIPSDFK